MNILIISDGKPGHQNQSLGIAERLPDAKALLFKHGLKEGFREGLLRWGIGRTKGRIKPNIAGAKLREIVTPKEIGEIARFEPHLVISAGSTSASVNLLFKGLFGVPSVCIMRPSLIPLSSFDIVILPAHDAAPDWPNVVRLVITPNMAYPEMARREADEFSARTGLPADGRYFTIVIGGKAKGMPFDKDACLDMLEACYRWADENDIILLLTTSRRTGSALERAIEERWGDDVHTGYMLLAGRDPENPTYGFYGLSGRALITADSMSMVSEAIYAGLRPVVVDLGAGAAKKGKRGRFYEGLRSGAYIDFAGSPDGITRALSRTNAFTGAGVPGELKACLKRIVDLMAGYERKPPAPSQKP
jgi:mitochondrial fission protein ELM1